LAANEETLRRPIMRASLVLLPIALTLASMPVVAQEAPRVIFCTGSCFAVDQAGARTPAPKGTMLREGQRLETGPGAYAQLKLGPDAALGVSERAQVRFDQRSVRDRDLVMLDQGRIRMVSGEAIGKAATRALELRTQDGTFALRGADIEVRRLQATAGAASGLTVVKVNAGDARLLNPQGGIVITKDAVQGVTAGKIVTDKSISVADVAPAPSRPGVAVTTAVVAPIQTVPVSNMPVAPLAPVLRPELIAAPSLPGVPTRPISGPSLVPIPPVTAPDRVITAAYVTTGQPGTLIELVAPKPASGAGLTIQPIIGKQLVLAPVGTAPTIAVLPPNTLTLTPLTKFCRAPC
jgi:hypothetical protein